MNCNHGGKLKSGKGIITGIWAENQDFRVAGLVQSIKYTIKLVFLRVPSSQKKRRKQTIELSWAELFKAGLR